MANYWEVFWVKGLTPNFKKQGLNQYENKNISNNSVVNQPSSSTHSSTTAPLSFCHEQM